MKFVALVLTILAVGSQARSLQADAPSQLDHVRSIVGAYLAQVKEHAEKTLDHLDDTIYKDYKVTLSTSLNKIENFIKTGSETLSPYSDAAVSAIAESTKQMRENIQADVDQLRVDLEPKRIALKEVMDKHINDYRKKLEPVIKEYMDNHMKRLDEFKTKIQPVVEELREQIPSNVEETKTKLMPIIEAIRAKLTDRLNELKEFADPYVKEYKEHLTEALKEVKVDQVENLQSKIQPVFEELKTKMMAIWETLSTSKSS